MQADEKLNFKMVEDTRDRIGMNGRELKVRPKKRQLLRSLLSILVVVPMLQIAPLGMKAAKAADALVPNSTVIPNVTPGASYIRIASNSTDTPTDFEVQVYGTFTGQLYRTLNFTVDQNVLKQLSPSNYQPQQQVDARDKTFFLVIQGSRPAITDIAGIYQHVRFDNNRRLIENMSECSFNARADQKGYYLSYFGFKNSFIPYAHTSKLGGYTSYINITNPKPTERSFQIVAYDAMLEHWNNNVNRVGVDNITVPAKSTVRIAVPDFERKINWTPRNDQVHTNMRVDERLAVGEVSSAIITHTIIDDTSQLETNMSAYCPIEGISKIKAPIGGGSYSQTRSNPNCDSGSEVVQGASCRSSVTDWAADTSTRGRFNGDPSPTGGGAHANGQLFPVGDVDWYKVRLNKGTGYVLAAQAMRIASMTGDNSDEQSALGKMQIKLYKSDGTPVQLETWEQGANDSNGNYTIYTAPDNGDYFVEVAALDGTSTGGYQVQAFARYKEDRCNPLDDSDRYAAENSCNPINNDFPATTATPGIVCVNCPRAVTSSILLTTDDVDWHKVRLTAGVRYIITVTPGPIGESVVGGVASANVRLISNARGEVATGKNQLDVTPTATEDYYLEVASDSGSKGYYFITANR